MKYRIASLYIVFYFTIIHCGYSQTYVKYWDKTYGGNSRDWNCQLVKSASGGLFLIGDSQTAVDGDKTVPLCNNALNTNSDIWLIRIDTSGSILWQRDLGASSDERMPQLTPLTFQDRMIFACHSLSDTACDKSEHNRDLILPLSPDYWMVLLDSNGIKIWDKTLGGDAFDENTQIVQLTPGDLIVSGESISGISGDKTVANYSASKDIWTLKLDASTGNKLWDKVYGGTGVEYLAGSIALPGGSFVLAGTTLSDSSGDVSQVSRGFADYWMIKVDNNGNKIWDKRYGGSLTDRCLYAASTPDNGFILCGYTVSPISGEVSEAPKGIQDYWIIKTDSLGNKQWDKRFGGNNGAFATRIAPAPIAGYWLAGYTDSGDLNDVSEPSYGGSDYWILRLDNSGNKIWDKRFGGNANEFTSSFELLADSSLLLFGYSDSGNSISKTAISKGWWDYWLVKFKYDNNSVGIDQVNNDNGFVTVYPNPNSGKFIVSSKPGNMEFGDVSVYDAIGNEIYKSMNVQLDNYQVDISNATRGIYFFKIKNGDRFYFSKIVKL